MLNEGALGSVRQREEQEVQQVQQGKTVIFSCSGAAGVMKTVPLAYTFPINTFYLCRWVNRFQEKHGS